jgi:hypothetical protein
MMIKPGLFRPSHVFSPALRRTINGKGELVAQDAAYKKLRQIAEEARILEGIRQGIDDMNAGRSFSLDEFKAQARIKHGIKS